MGYFFGFRPVELVFFYFVTYSTYASCQNIDKFMTPALYERMVVHAGTGEKRQLTTVIGVGKKVTVGVFEIRGTPTGFEAEDAHGRIEQITYDDIDEHDSVDNTRYIKLTNDIVVIKAIQE